MVHACSTELLPGWCSPAQCRETLQTQQRREVIEKLLPQVWVSSEQHTSATLNIMRVRVAISIQPGTVDCVEAVLCTLNSGATAA